MKTLKNLRYDVVCAGGGASGVFAAVAATRTGARVLLFTTSTCPKCKVAGAMLDSAALPFEKIVADQSGNEELARAYGISQAPTLVVQNGDEVEKYSDVAAIKRYIDAAKGGQ